MQIINNNLSPYTVMQTLETSIKEELDFIILQSSLILAIASV